MSGNVWVSLSSWGRCGHTGAGRGPPMCACPNNTASARKCGVVGRHTTRGVLRYARVLGGLWRRGTHQGILHPWEARQEMHIYKIAEY